MAKCKITITQYQSAAIGIRTSIKSIAIPSAAPEGTPPRRFKRLTTKQEFAPPCLGEALRRGTLLTIHHFNPRDISAPGQHPPEGEGPPLMLRG